MLVHLRNVERDKDKDGNPVVDFTKMIVALVLWFALYLIRRNVMLWCAMSRVSS